MEFRKVYFDLSGVFPGSLISDAFESLSGK